MREMIQRPGGVSPQSNEIDASEHTQTDVPAFDIKKYFYIVAKRSWLLLICFAISVSVTFVKIMRQQPEYRSAAKIQLTRGVVLPSNLQQREEQMILGDYVATQRDIIQSGGVLKRAREKLGMTPQEFSSNFRSLDIARQRETAILNIVVVGMKPAFCAQYANAIADAYLEYKQDERADYSQTSSHNLSRETTRLLGELEKKEEALRTFVKENSVVGIQERGNVAAELLAQLSKQAAEYKTQRMLLEAQQPLLAQATDEVVLVTLSYGLSSISSLSSAIPTGSTVEEDPESLIEHGVISPKNWDTLKRENALLEARLATYRQKYKDAHPLIQETVLQLQQNEEAMSVELKFALRQFYFQLEALHIKEKAAHRVEQEWEEQALEIDRKQKEYESLLREQRRLQSLYELIFNRLKEIDISLEIQVEPVRILERAQESSNPIEPRKMQILFMAALIGLGIGLGLIFLLEYMDDSIRYPEDMTKTLGIPFLGLVPSAHWPSEEDSSHLLVNIDPESGFVEAYRNIRSALTLNPEMPAFRSLAITSTIPQEGKTTTASNIAICFAQAGKKVLLVDADLRRGGLHHYFNLRAGRGLTDYLNGQNTFAEVTQSTAIPSLDFVATGPFPANPAEIVLRPEMKEFLDTAMKQYDLIILDTPPVMAVSEAPVLTSLVDGTLVVVWAGHTSKKLVGLTIRQLRIRGANLLGGILNNLDFNRVGYYYYSTYYNYYSYEYRYRADTQMMAKDGTS